ncbi:cuticle protein 76 [Drosophila sulfurigaster albostrigata]|uniref:cuticle protein 76 n=1 Tax=Drosophila sulfurigaster albostrigata TaxID=89887 RepID=UPI002D218AAF|nr:cuticle protein 76 [Drosophila sulfurigaster albostrigata]
MAFKYVLLSLCAVLSAANAGLLAPATYVASPVVAKLAQPHYDAVGTTQQNVVRSFGGTVSTYSKNVVTPYSSVSKIDSRITNNVYTPKTVYSAPAAVVTKSVYAAAAPAPVAYAAPAVHYAAPAPVVAKTVYAAPAPVVAKTVYAAPAPVVAAPVIAKTYAAPAVYSAPVAGPVIAKTYAAPAVYSAPVAAPAAFVKFSPAIGAAHVSFDGFGSHWGY